MPALAGAAEIRASSFNETDNTIDIVWTTGAKVRRYSWSEGPYDEELVVSKASVRLDRLNAGAPLLNTHASGQLSDVIGSVVPGSAKIEGGRGVATVQLTTRADAEGIVADIKAGVIRNISVGYRYHRVEKIEGRDGDPALWRVTDWEPLEVSAVPIPADPGAQFRSEPDAGTFGGAYPFALIDAAAATRSTSLNPLEPTLRPQPTAHVIGPNGGSERVAAMENALLNRAWPSDHKLVDAAREFAAMDLLDIARSCVEGGGVSIRGMERIEVVDRAFNPVVEKRSDGSMTTSDFPVLLANVASKSLLKGYDAEPQTFRPFTRETTATDFKPMTRVIMGEAPPLLRVAEGGEFRNGTIGEGSQVYSLLTYGRKFSVTRQAIVNDDLDAFTRVPRLFGEQVSNLESDLVYREFLGNPVMPDGLPIFHADHNNLGTAAGISAASVANGFEAMRHQKGFDGRTRFNLAPKFILVPVSAAFTVEQLYTPIFPSSVANSVPGYIKSLVPISEPRLDAGMTDPLTGAEIAGNRFHWYLIADPAKRDTVELAYLRGQRGPQLQQHVGFNVDGMEFRIRLDAAAKLIDWRSFYKNPATTL